MKLMANSRAYKELDLAQAKGKEAAAVICSVLSVQKESLQASVSDSSASASLLLKDAEQLELLSRSKLVRAFGRAFEKSNALFFEAEFVQAMSAGNLELLRKVQAAEQSARS